MMHGQEINHFGLKKFISQLRQNKILYSSVIAQPLATFPNHFIHLLTEWMNDQI